MGKVFLLPLWIAKAVFGLLWAVVKVILSLGQGTVRFSIRNLPGILAGAIGAVLAAKFIADRKKA